MSEIEERVLSALRQQLISSELVQAAIDEYSRERTRLAKERRKLRSRLEGELADVTNKIERMLDLLQDGNIEKGEGVARVNQLAAEKKRLTQELADDPAPTVIEVYPNAGQRYAEKVAEIHAALGKGGDCEIEAVNLVRSLIQRIVAHPTPERQPMRLEVVGTLALLLQNEGRPEHSGIMCCVPPQPLLL